jgi:hypothetical protein
LLADRKGTSSPRPPLPALVPRAVDDGVVGDGRKPAQEAAGRSIREVPDIAKRPQAGLLHQVFHLAELLRPRAQLVVNQHRQTPPVAFESARQRLFVAAFGLFQQREGGCGRFHTCAVCALGT